VSTDLPDGKQLERTLILDDVEFAINDVNPYCAFWMYDKDEFRKFCKSECYSLKELHQRDEYGVCETSAIGMNGKANIWYEGTLIPVINNQVHPDSKVLHLPNNFMNHEPEPGVPLFGTVPFKEIVQR
jgi:hypothetical protein